jgi:hypothetical protein
VNYRFDPSDPFPNLDLSTVPYVLQKEHAKAADAFLGFQVETIESTMLQKTARSDHAAQWIGLDPDSLQTPYLELRFMLAQLNLQAGDTIVDLGAAYGRMGFVVAAHHPNCNFIGIEVAEARVSEGNRVLQIHQIKNAKLIRGDAASAEFHLPEAQAYFLYDLSEKATILRVIDRLRERSRKLPVCVVGRGRATRDQIERHEPWLSQVNRPKHFGNFTLYFSS